jgi:hypothetical protein
MTHEIVRDPVADRNPTGSSETSTRTKASLSFQVYDNFGTRGYSLTISGSPGPTSTSEIVSALAVARN